MSKSSKTIFTYELSNEYKKEIINFYNKFEFISINQFIEWEQINNQNKKICYYLKFDNDNLLCYSIILENKKIAYINYGPIADDYSNIIVAIKDINKYFKEKYFLKVVYKLSNVDETSKKINEFFENEYTTSNYPFNWSTLIIDLRNKTIDEIYNSFSKNHKRAIKKSQKNKLQVKEISNENDIEIMSKFYDEMYNHRHIKKSFLNTYTVFSNIYEYFKKYNNGFILGVYKEDKLIGGLILPLQGKSLYYQYGVASVNNRNIPILHIAFFEAIRLAKSKGLYFFDFGGYIKNIKKTDQINNINKFKKGFGGELLEYNENMHFILSPIKYFIYILIRKIYFYFFR